MNISALENIRYGIFLQFLHWLQNMRSLSIREHIARLSNNNTYFLNIAPLLINFSFMCTRSVNFTKKGTFIDYALSAIYHAISRKVC